MNPSVIAFDVDGVLLEPKSSWSTIHNYFGVKNENNLNQFIKGEIGYQEFVDRDVKLWLEKRKEITKNDFRKIGKMVNPNPNFRYLSHFLENFNGKKIAISGGVDVIVARVNDYFPLDEVYSNVLIFENEMLSRGKAVVNPYDKGTFLKKFKGKKISVGDSEWDIDLFKNSEYSILFNSQSDLDDVDCIIKGNDLKDLTKVLEDLI